MKSSKPSARQRLWQALLRGRPGRRFRDHYRRRRGTRRHGTRIAGIAGGAILLLLGLLTLPAPIPGPALLLMLAGGALIARESRRAAAALDWTEVRLRMLARRRTGFGPRLETQYQATRYREYRSFSRNVGIAGVALSLGLWIRDYVDDPAGAAGTFPLRFIMASGVALYVAALTLPVRRGLALASGYTAILTIEFVVLAIWGRLAGGYTAGFPGYMYIYLLTPLVLLPFTFRESAWALVLVAVLPNLQYAAGMAPGFPVLAFNALIWPACGIGLFALAQLDLLFRELFVSRHQLVHLATHDALTSLANRRYFLSHAEELVGLARRHERPLAALMVDIDHFKAINDRYGHAAGDAVLRTTAAKLRRGLRGTDLCGRIGGEEFAAVLPETDARSAVATAERMRKAVASASVIAPDGKHAISVRVSIGVASLGADCDTVERLLAQADRMLYAAKAGGRNRVASAPAHDRAALTA